MQIKIIFEIAGFPIWWYICWKIRSMWQWRRPIGTSSLYCCIKYQSCHCVRFKQSSHSSNYELMENWFSIFIFLCGDLLWWFDCNANFWCIYSFWWLFIKLIEVTTHFKIFKLQIYLLLNTASAKSIYDAFPVNWISVLYCADIWC